MNQLLLSDNVNEMKLTERNLIKEFYRCHNQRYEIVVNNMYVNNSFSESDIFTVRPSGFCDEIEVKLSLSDFKADFSKTISKNGVTENKHKCISNGLLACNYFSYLVPKALQSKINLPEYAGLYIAVNHGDYLIISEIKKPRKLHSNKISVERKYKMLRKMHYRYWAER